MFTKVAAALIASGDTAARALTTRPPAFGHVPASLHIAVMSNEDIDAMPNGRTEWAPEQVSATQPVYASHENATRRKFRQRQASR